MALTPEQRAQFIAIIDVAMEMIEAAGPMGLPSGELYAYLMPTGMRIDQYQGILDGLKSTGLVTESGFLLKSTGQYKSIRPREDAVK